MSEIRGIGTDLCEVSRMEALLTDDRFLNRYFDETEIACIRSRKAAAAETMAGTFAAKEAFAKALGTGLVFPLKEVGVRHDERGAPLYALTGRAAELLAGGRAHLSISHDGGMAIAFCVLEKTSI